MNHQLIWNDRRSIDEKAFCQKEKMRTRSEITHAQYLKKQKKKNTTKQTILYSFVMRELINGHLVVWWWAVRVCMRARIRNLFIDNFNQMEW